MEERAAWLALARLPGLQRARTQERARACGGPLALLRRPALLADASAQPPLLARPEERLAEAHRALADLRARDIAVLTPADPDFPAALAHIPDPPLALYARGALPSGASLAVVGSRRASSRARLAARRLAAALAGDGVAIVSGLAYGVDAAAHEGALEANGPTVAVLASGVDVPSPRGNRGLAERILRAGGGFLSEYPPGTSARPYHFPERNRLICGLASAALIVEARERSGTLWTARHALEQSRPVGVVPGPIDTDLCRGSNALLREGAEPILDADDLRRLVLGYDPGWRPERRARALARPELARIVEALRDGPVDTDGLGRAVALTPPELAAALLELELQGAVAREGARVILLP